MPRHKGSYVARMFPLSFSVNVEFGFFETDNYREVEFFQEFFYLG